MNKFGELDDFDRRIIALLRDQPRLQNRALAKAIGVSDPTIYARLRDLEGGRVCEVRAQRDFAAMGYTTIAFMDLAVRGRPIRTVAKELAGHDQVMAVLEFLEEPRLQISVVAADGPALAHFVSEALGSVDGISRVTVHTSLGLVAYGADAGEIGVDRHRPLPPCPGGSGLDDIDEAILESLRLDPRQSNRQIAANLDISEASVRQRLGRLQEQGAMKFTLVCKPSALGANVWGYIRLAVPPARLAAVVALLRDTPASQSLSLTSGVWNIHCFALFETERELGAFLEQLEAFAGDDIDLHARKVHRVEKHNCDYVRIISGQSSAPRSPA